MDIVHNAIQDIILEMVYVRKLILIVKIIIKLMEIVDLVILDLFFNMVHANNQKTKIVENSQLQTAFIVYNVIKDI